MLLHRVLNAFVSLGGSGLTSFFFQEILFFFFPPPARHRFSYSPTTARPLLPNLSRSVRRGVFFLWRLGPITPACETCSSRCIKPARDQPWLASPAQAVLVSHLRGTSGRHEVGLGSTFGLGSVVRWLLAGYPAALSYSLRPHRLLIYRPAAHGYAPPPFPPGVQPEIFCQGDAPVCISIYSPPAEA